METTLTMGAPASPGSVGSSSVGGASDVDAVTALVDQRVLAYDGPSAKFKGVQQLALPGDIAAKDLVYYESGTLHRVPIPATNGQALGRVADAWGAVDLSALQPNREVTKLQAFGLKGWAFDPAALQANYVLSSGQVVGHLVGLAAGDVVTNIVTYCTSAGTTTLLKVALHALDGTRLAVSASSSWTVNQFNVIALTAPYTVLASGGFYLTQLWVGTGTAAIIRGGNNGNLAARIGSNAFWAVNQNSQSDMPNPATFTALGADVWLGWN